LEELSRHFEKWIAVIGERGTGKTAALFALAEQLGEKTYLFIDATDYAEVAAQIPLYQYVAEKVYGRDRTSEVARRNFITWLEAEDNEKRAIWLVDDLMLLAPDDRKWIMRQLQRSNGQVIFTVRPNFIEQPDATLKGEIALYELIPLDDQDIEQLADEWCAQQATEIDRLLLRRVCREVPELAASPLGLTTILEQLAEHQSDCASITERYIAKIYARDQLPVPNWKTSYENALPHVEALWRAARETFDRRRVHQQQGSPHEFVYHEEVYQGVTFEFITRPADQILLTGVKESPLLWATTTERTWRWINRQVYAFLLAAQVIQDLFAPGHKDLASESDGGLIQRYVEALIDRGWRRSFPGHLPEVKSVATTSTR
jgi:hypothetical protein